jgi:2-keto-4-pentenoate hydratase/2-oxohepta-3-ene-1,7-dioic acid hydratase in catechol pathway
MRRARVRDPAGSVRLGEWTDDEVILSTGSYSHAEVDVLPPTEPSKIVCLARNYVEHAGGDPPERPSFFFKAPNALASHGDTVTLPKGVDEVHYEAEVGVVIGEQCRNVDEADALDFVEGYTNVNDLSNRDDQREEQNWIRGKSFDNSGPVGPAVADPEHVSDPEDPRIRLWLNGEKMQDSKDDSLVHNVSEVISEFTEHLTLERGDIIAMGTSGHPTALSDGDKVEIEVDGVGRLTHWVEEP